jgi:hypothetical protein
MEAHRRANPSVCWGSLLKVRPMSHDVAVTLNSELVRNWIEIEDVQEAG